MNSPLLLTVHDGACLTNTRTVCQVYSVTSSLLEQGINWYICDDILWNTFWLQITGNGIPNDRTATLQSFCLVIMTQDSLRAHLLCTMLHPGLSMVTSCTSVITSQRGCSTCEITTDLNTLLTVLWPILCHFGLTRPSDVPDLLIMEGSA